MLGYIAFWSGKLIFVLNCNSIFKSISVISRGGHVNSILLYFLWQDPVLSSIYMLV